MDRFRRIQIHFFKGYNRATILMVITSIIIRQISALDSYKFRLGTNAIIPFSYALDEHSQHSWEIFRIGVSDPFNINGTMKPDALNPRQRNRFNISTTWGEDVLQVDLHIREISKIDRGVYVWAVSQHTIRAERLVVSFDVFVDVILPPGRAKCVIISSPYSSGLREVHCQAAVGSDRGGLLICYQNDVKTPFQSPPAHSATDVSAVFWMDAQYDIKCCSHEANYERVPRHCNDFTKAALVESNIQPKTTRSPVLTSLKSNGKTVLGSSASEIEHSPDSASSTEEAKYIDSVQCVCFERKTLHFVYGITLGILFILLVILVCIIIKTRKSTSDRVNTKKKETNREEVGRQSSTEDRDTNNNI